MWDYFRKHPEIRKIPYELNSFEPPFVKRFALRQYQLMQQQGLSKQRAYEEVSEEMRHEKEDLLGCVFAWACLAACAMKVIHCRSYHWLSTLASAVLRTGKPMV